MALKLKQMRKQEELAVGVREEFTIIMYTYIRMYVRAMKTAVTGYNLKFALDERRVDVYE